MRLNRKQKTLRNFLFMLVLLFLWWMLLDFPPLTQSQALRWEAQELGFQERPQVICRSDWDSHHRDVVFTVEGKVGLAQMGRGVLLDYATIYQVKEQEEVTVLWRDTTPMGDFPAFCVVTEFPKAETVEVQLRMEDHVTLGHYTTPLEVDWDECYTFRAKAKHGAAFFAPEGKYSPEYNEDAEGYVPFRLEEEVLMDFCNALRGYDGDDSRFIFTATIWDQQGNTLAAYEETI